MGSVSSILHKKRKTSAKVGPNLPASSTSHAYDAEFDESPHFYHSGQFPRLLPQPSPHPHVTVNHTSYFGCIVVRREDHNNGSWNHDIVQVTPPVLEE
ncbi:hypothetical protein SERLA73DRAFT_188999 [Serpula lacrymans var. lacrymans S7.3]|uniref:Uncharacterized protein n=2 Tax=Serpula lacrymans var. lacrymans TaxID=341189 RepID=F8QCL5_SERL3|nr:uncharacterized protein SERLADRAFT_479627 [Serpula lacrymans var. lacrymans S7.9]EGN93880.1 hypothetical protein SERLA73DRAFT_188999 [Serpula lacrymans var. lacrymans S7.3]EGO19247.1 hypothetical protein SERLADRAFT_479627 [Serpula lacrymans var. lacrymans S7.9]